MTVDVTSDNVDRLIDMGQSFSDGMLINYINILQEAGTKLHYATAKRVILEVAIIKMCKPQMQEGEAALERRVEELEQALEQALEQLKQSEAKVVYVQSDQVPVGENVASETSATGDEQAANLGDKVMENLKTKYKEADIEEILTIVDSWNYIKANAMKLTRNYMDMVSVRAGSVPSTIDLVIVKSPEKEMAINYYDKQSNVDTLRKAISDMTERDVAINVVKISPKEAVETKLNEWDLSKIKAKIDYKY